MAFSVTTYQSEAELATALTATVTTHPDEDSLLTAVEAATSVTAIVAKGGYFTLIDDASIVNVNLWIVAKGGYYTVILETA
jgi:hypothetical protein